MKIRQITPDELDIVTREVAHFGARSPPLEPELLHVRAGTYDEVFLIDAPLDTVLSATDDDPIYMGLKLGEIVKGRLRVSLEFATMLAPTATEHIVTLDDERSTLFLYGRDIFASNLPQLPLGRTIVRSQDGACLGIGIFDGRKLANVVDKGAYLRRYQ